MATPLDFKKLFLEENDLFSQVDSSSKKETLKQQLTTETPGPAGEPWIRYTPFDRVGLAFSGGGIRSATFNLGILKALHELHVLKYVDYLSTVSGGGYIGAWWTAWRARTGKDFPQALLDPKADKNIRPEEKNREPEEVRHLREFSNFLSPRIGFFESEMWNAVMAVLSAVLPAVLVASSVIALAFLVWLGVNSLILADALNMPVSPSAWLECLNCLKAPLVLLVITIATYIVLERSWRRSGKAEPLSSSTQRGFFGFDAAILTLFTLGIYFGWYLLTQVSWINFPPRTANSLWLWSTGISPQGAGFSFSPHLFDASIIWASVALVLLVPRLLFMRLTKVSFSGTLINAVDRALSRMLGAALVFAVLAALWLAGCWLNCRDWGRSVPAGGAFASGGAFALLRRWIANLGPAKKGGVMDIIKPLIPQILAYVAIALWAICIAALLAGSIEKDIFPVAGLSTPWVLLIVALVIVLFAIFFFDPAQVSLHSFYRNRLTRAYLGASNLDAGAPTKKLAIFAEANRQTDVRKRDDIELSALSPTIKELIADQKKSENDRVYIGANTCEAGRIRPLHLICCAANDLGGDQLGNLSRGARSAVLSKLGFAIGDHWKEWETNVPTLRATVARAVSASMLKVKKRRPRWLAQLSKKTRNQETLMLGSAITASAAAFNSNMGSLSMTLGAGVTFLCSALNLRLGLWLRHPLSHGRKVGVPKLWPGWLFLKEMFGATNSGLRPGSNSAKPVAKYVHLSDGGHFEDLALYELVRRHCRYIIVSDCGADPKVAFDDFGNAVRRIREDFGVEIDIDLSPLKPSVADADRLSKQHVAVGTISYDPRGDRKDSAILLYFKPTLTGDEPADIAQYKTRNEDFPHETTGDQFYDEAQWESYRRLGEHAAHSALGFVERERRRDELSADEIFNGARWEWYQSPERLQEKFVELTGRFTALEAELREKAPEKFVREMFPELQTINAESGPDTPMNPKEMSRVLHFLLQIIQLMEDVWVACQLETHWNDPNNVGWMNAFQRWAYTPSFRLWWPILKPMYGSKFRRFMEERLSLADEDYPPTLAEVNHQGKLPGKKVPSGVAQIYWKRMNKADLKNEAGKTVYSFDLELTLQRQQGEDTTYHVQAGLAFLDLSQKQTDPPKRTTAHWTNEEFFLPPSLWGAGLGAKFLDKLLVQLKKEKFDRCEVTIKPPKRIGDEKVAFEWLERTDLASRQQLNDLLAFYQRAGFSLDDNGQLVRDLDDIIVPKPQPSPSDRLRSKPV